MTANLRHAAGSLLVVGLSGTELTGLERAWLKVVRPAGVILFRRNIADALQTRALLGEATALCTENAFRCVDVEGGSVDRLRDALAPMPSAQAVAAADRARNEGVGSSRRGQRFSSFLLGKGSSSPTLATKGSRQDGARGIRDGAQGIRDGAQGLDAGIALEKTLGYEHGELIAQGVRAFGFNVTLAPVLDLALPDSAGVMGTRTAGATAGEVAAYARAFLAGLAAQGAAGCGKHFPGLGGGTRDSHLETPEIRRSWRDLWAEDLAPYRDLAAAMPMVMVNHAAYPDTSSKELPATASKFWITTVLRKRLGYCGLIFSDDMEMGGILKFQPMEEAAVAAIRAGMDTLEICHSPELILRAYEALLAEAERSAAFRNLLLARASEVQRKRKKLIPTAAPRPLTPKQYEALRSRILRFRDKVMQIAEDNTSPAISKDRTATLVETA